MPAKSVKAAQTPEKSLKDRSVDAALSLAAAMGWDMVTMADIASEADTDLAALSDIFDDKNDILIALGRRIDRHVLENVGVGSPSDSPRDRLFEIMMERFDVMAGDRDAILSMLSSFKADPKEALISLPHLSRSMNWMMEAAGLETSGIKGAIRVAGLTLVYANCVRVWMKDDSADLSKTMATLDKSLERAEQAAGTFML